MYSRDELFLCSLECYFCVYFPRCFATREINTKITLSWALKQFVTQVHTLFSIFTMTSRVLPLRLPSVYWHTRGTDPGASTYVLTVESWRPRSVLLKHFKPRCAFCSSVTHGTVYKQTHALWGERTLPAGTHSLCGEQRTLPELNTRHVGQND